MRDFDKFHSLIFHVETPPGVRRRSSLLLWHRVVHGYANVRRDAPTAQFCTYTHITGLLAQAYSNELLAGSTRLWSRTPYLINRYRLTRVRLATHQQQTFIHYTIPAVNQINATATTTTELHDNKRNEASDRFGRHQE